MAHTFVSLDFYNENFSCRLNGNSYVFSSKENFATYTGFPFIDVDTVKILSYEPDRNLYYVEKYDGTVLTDRSSDPIRWIENNLSVIEQGAKNDVYHNRSIITAIDQRSILLFQTDYILQRHQEETALNITHTLTDQQLNDVLVYRQALRDLVVTKSVDGGIYPKTVEDVSWPTNPLA